MTRLIRIVNPNEFKPVHIVMLALLLLALAGNCLLTSAGKSVVLPDGANAWPSDSLLLAVVEILDLQFTQPTPNGVAIKSLVAGTAAGLGIIVAVIGVFFRVRSRSEDAGDDAVIEVDENSAEDTEESEHSRPKKKHIDPILASQVLMLLYVAWALAATFWSNAPSFALGGAIILGINVLWSFALSIILNRRAAVISGYCLVGVLTVTAGVACWYWFERNSIHRAAYPIGNALFLAACLIPGILIAAAFIAQGFNAVRDHRVARGVTFVLIFVVAAAVMIAAFYLTDSRGPKIGLVLGLIALAAFAGGRDVKMVAAVMGVIGIAVVAIYFFNQRDATTVSGRSESMRFRIYAWDYAMELFGERPLVGHGLGGYALLADGLAAQDVLKDPVPLGNRVSHAHGEWLEVASDLGGIGLVLLMGSLFLAVYGGTNAIPDISDSVPRWMLIGVSAALAALIAEECFSVGLQISGLPFVFYTVLGLVWALARPFPDAVVAHMVRQKWIVWAGLVLGFVFGFGALEYSRRDFVAARALNDLGQKLAESDWQKAADLSRTSYEYRLRPQRKLVALIQKLASQLYVAEQLQVQYVRRLRIRGSSQRIDPGLEQHLASDREKCEELLKQSTADLEFTQSIVSSKMGIGMLEYKLRTLRAVFAEIDGRANDVIEEGILAANALGAQLERQPFETELATKFVIASVGRLEVATAVEVLARPLRMGIVTDQYVQAVGVLMANPEIKSQVLARIDQEMLTFDAEMDVAKRLENWSPEILRIGAVAAYVQEQLEDAVSHLKAAIGLYDEAVEAELRVPPLAYAGCYAELADALFLASPETPQPAIKAAEMSLQRAPASRDGRVLIGRLRERIMAYHLAAEHEDFVRDRLAEQMPSADAKQLDRELANRYAKMAYSVLGRAYDRIPYKLNGWSQRALALDSESATNWFLAADIAILVGDESRTIERINHAIENGGGPQDIYSIVVRAFESMPNSLSISRMRAQIEMQLGIAAPTGATPEVTSPGPIEPGSPSEVMDDSQLGSQKSSQTDAQIEQNP